MIDPDAAEPPTSVGAPSEPPPSWRRRWGKRALGFVVAAALTELGAAIVYPSTTGEWFSYERMHERRAALESPTDPPDREVGANEERPSRPRTLSHDLSEQALHPYVGFINDPSGDPWAESPPFAHAARLFEPDSGTLRVLVVGGSVAGQVHDEGGAALRSALEPGLYAGREVDTVSLAVGGYKQPQQLSLVTYLLSVGARFDVLINIDGFNEAVLPWVENASEGVYPLYPRWWDLRLIGIDDVETVGEVGTIRAYEDIRRDAAHRLDDSFLRYSVTANVVWDVVDRWAQRRAYEHTLDLRRHQSRRSYQRAGPAAGLDREQTLRVAAENWARSSILIDRLSERGEFVYVHVLQPNQYLEGTKPLSDEERRLHYRPDEPFGRVAPDGYAQLLAQAHRLHEAGVRFHDLTRIFEDDPRTLYMDDCCHFNQLGVDLLAARIGELVVRDATEGLGAGGDEPEPGGQNGAAE